MELGRYVRLLIQWWWLLVPGTVLAGGVAYWIARQTPPVYEATVTVMVDVPTRQESRYEDELLDEQLVNTYVHVAAMPFVLEEASRRLGLQLQTEELRARVRVRPTGAGTSLFTITTGGGTPADAEQLANAVAEVFVEQQPLQVGPTQMAAAVRVVQPARQPSGPARPRVLLDTLVGAVLGLVVLHCAVFGLRYLRS